MHRVLIHLTVFALVAHVWLGCCWHHRHASCAEPSHAIAVDPLAGEHPLPQLQHGGHSGRCADQPAGAHPSGSCGCELGRCTGVGPALGRWPTAPFDRLATSATTAALPPDKSPAESVLLGQVAEAMRRCPPLRLHLVYQVLLI